jgi:DNA mismatch endonuclease (patch repair protein)
LILSDEITVHTRGLTTMPDNLTKAQRSYTMSRIKGKDTGIERVVRSGLHKMGYRFRKHVATLPGKPDIVFSSARVAVFIDGDFWHGYRFSQWKEDLSQFWIDKIAATRRRDRGNFRKLRRMGWRVVRVWQHEIERDLNDVISRIATVVEENSSP